MSKNQLESAASTENGQEYSTNRGWGKDFYREDMEPKLGNWLAVVWVVAFFGKVYLVFVMGCN